MTPETCAKHIKSLQLAIDSLKSDIDDIAKLKIKDFHFMSHRVSTFWECKGSPIGMCVFHVNDYGVSGNCYYCGGPVERK